MHAYLQYYFITFQHAYAISPLSLLPEYEFGDVTKKVVASFADEATVAPKDRQTIGTSAKIIDAEVIEALDNWDGLSEKQLQDGLNKIEQYVESVEQEQLDEKKK